MSNSIIRYDDVQISRKDLIVFDNISFGVSKGDFVYITGRVGSGKSTLLKSIFADIPINKGMARVLDYDLINLKQSKIPQLRRKIGFIFQEFRLLNDRDIQANLDYVLKATGMKDPKSREDRIEQVLQLVGMKEKSYKLPFELSGGEQQQVAVARALLNEPDIILADEPTGNLDAESGENVVQQLYRASRNGTTVLIATHNVRLLDIFPGRQLHCDNHKLVEITR